MKKALLVWFLVAVLAAAGCTAAPEGAGIPSNPYKIRDWHELAAIGNNLTASYILMKDLDASSAGYAVVAGPDANEGKGWKPIGTLHEGFTGSLAGQGYEIRDLSINRVDEDAVGLFGYVDEGALIDSVGVVNVDVIGNDTVGGLVGYNGGTVSDSYSTGRITGGDVVGGLVGVNRGVVTDSFSSACVSGDERVGGLVGHNWGGTVRASHAAGSVTGGEFVGGLAGYVFGGGTVGDSYASGNVTGGMSVGGLVGWNGVGTVTSSYASGNVTGNGVVGGLVGANLDTLSNSYAAGVVTGEEWVGGLVGRNTGTLSNSYAAGSVTGETSVGGLVGWNTGTVSDSFWDVEASGMEESAGGTGKTTAEMRNIDTFTDVATGGLHEPWDMAPVAHFDPWDPSTWYIEHGIDYPRLYFENPHYPPAPFQITTEPATGVVNHTATLNMAFTLYDCSTVDVRFSWREFGAPGWETTGWVPKTESATHAETLTGLGPGTAYEFKAQLQHNDSVTDGDTLTFTTAAEYNLTISSTAGGSVNATVEEDVTVIGPGETKTIFDIPVGTAVGLVGSAEPEYEFLQWQGRPIDGLTNPAITIAIYGNHAMTARFESDPDHPDTYDLTVSSTGGGSVSIPGEGVFSYVEGSVADLAASADDNYRFVDWTGDVESIDDVDSARTTIQMDGDYSVTADFGGPLIPPTYTLTMASTAGGSVIEPGEGEFTYDQGTEVPLKAAAAEGYRFVSWTSDFEGIIDDRSARETFLTVPGADVTVTANFQALPVLPTVTTGPASDITLYSAVISMTYTTGNFTPVYVRFASRRSGEAIWVHDIWLSRMEDGSYACGLTDLQAQTEYEFTAQLRYDDTVIEGEIRRFTTPSRPTVIFPPFCFIATAAYGSPSAEQIDVLREFRDVVLARNSLGSRFVALYYQVSPPVAEIISESGFLRTLTREFLVDPVVWIVEATATVWRSNAT